MHKISLSRGACALWALYFGSAMAAATPDQARRLDEFIRCMFAEDAPAPPQAVMVSEEFDIRCEAGKPSPPRTFRFDEGRRVVSVYPISDTPLNRLTLSVSADRLQVSAVAQCQSSASERARYQLRIVLEQVAPSGEQKAHAQRCAKELK